MFGFFFNRKSNKKKSWVVQFKLEKPAGKQVPKRQTVEPLMCRTWKILHQLLCCAWTGRPWIQKHWRWRWRRVMIVNKCQDFIHFNTLPIWVNAGRFSQIPKSSFNSLPFPIPCHYCRSRFIYNLHYVSIRGEYNVDLFNRICHSLPCLNFHKRNGYKRHGVIPLPPVSGACAQQCNIDACAATSGTSLLWFSDLKDHWIFTWPWRKGFISHVLMRLMTRPHAETTEGEKFTGVEIPRSFHILTALLTFWSINWWPKTKMGSNNQSPR